MADFDIEAFKNNVRGSLATAKVRRQAAIAGQAQQNEPALQADRIKAAADRRAKKGPQFGDMPELDTPDTPHANGGS